MKKMDNYNKGNKWDQYADAYNDLALHMEEAGIDIDKLKCVMSLYSEYLLKSTEDKIISS